MKLITYKEYKRIQETDRLDPYGRLELRDLLGHKAFSEFPWRYQKHGEYMLGWHGVEEKLIIKETEEALDILHEICHYLLCPNTRLTENDFGLGVGFRSMDINADATIDHRSAEAEEIAVCMLSYAFMKYFKFNKGHTAYVIYDQYMDSLSEAAFTKINDFIVARLDRVNRRLTKIKVEARPTGLPPIFQV